MKKLIAALFLALSLVPALAQVPPPVPALPDAERRTSYSISGTTCACSVGFALYGDSTNIDAWVEVWISNVRYLSTDSTHGWSLSSVTGSLATIARPITNAVLTFNAVQTGVVQIVGARRPIRASQFNENQGVPARNLNQVLTDIVAQNRETWDRTNDVTGRALLTLPGDTTPGALPLLAARKGTVLGFDTNGNPIPLNPNLGLGTVVGPVSTVDGHVAVFSGTSGQIIRDGGTGIGTVLSVGLSLPGIFTVTGSPVTNTGTLTGALATQVANLVWAGPTTGSAAAPTFRALVGADLPLPGASALGGIFSKAAVTSNWLRSLGTDGNLTASQPSFNDIAGTISPSQLPPPTASTLGGIESYVAVSNQWINSISTAGVPISTQPAFTNISGSVAATQMPALTGDVATSAGAVATTIAANAVTNAKAAQMGAATLKGNPTGSTANAQDFTIQGLTARGPPDATNDKIPLYDNAAGTIKYVTPTQIASAATAGVSSLNGLSGGLSIAAGTGVSVSAAGSNVTVTSSTTGTYTLSHASGSWLCTAPDGSSVSTGGTTTSGLQECISAMQSAKTGALKVLCGPANTLSASTVVTFGPAIGYKYDLSGCDFTSTASTVAITIDTFAQGTVFDWSGGYIHCHNQTLACILIQPRNGDPLFGQNFSQQSTYRFPYVNSDACSGGAGSMAQIIYLDATVTSTSQFINNNISIAGLDGNAALNCANQGILVGVPTGAGNAIAQNTFQIGLVANFKTAGMVVCNSTSYSGICATNEWHVSVNIGVAGVSAAIQSGGFLDQWFIPSISINAGSCTTGISLVGAGTWASPTGGWGNIIHSGQIGCAAPFSYGGSLKNSFIVTPSQGGSWISSAPTVTCSGGTVSAATNVLRYSQVGPTIFFNLDLTLTTLSGCTTTSGGGIVVPVPFVFKSNVTAAAREIAATGNVLNGFALAGASTIKINNVNNTCSDCTSGARFILSGSVETQ